MWPPSRRVDRRYAASTLAGAGVNSSAGETCPSAAPAWHRARPVRVLEYFSFLCSEPRAEARAYARRLMYRKGRWTRHTKAGNARCEDCGLGADEIDQLIDDWRHTTLTRDEALALFRATFERPEDAELCEDCAEAVLDAAGGPG